MSELSYATVECGTWDELLDFYQEFVRPVTTSFLLFRGQRDATWPLETSLERVASRFRVPAHERHDLEQRLLRRFQRQAHHYIEHVPPLDDTMQWLALMQHHGAPTRLMDWTYSFFVAVFFALEDCDADKPCAIWSLNAARCRKRAETLLDFDTTLRRALDADPHAKKPWTVDGLVFRREPQALAYPLNPFQLNERLVIQQGAFLVPGDLEHSFESNLARVLAEPEELRKVVLRLTYEEISVALTELLRMNMSRATLFPGLDGYSASMKCLPASPFVIQLPDARDADDV